MLAGGCQAAGWGACGGATWGGCSGLGLVGAGVGVVSAGDMLGAGGGVKEGELSKGVASSSFDGSLMALLHPASSTAQASDEARAVWCEIMCRLVYRWRSVR
jgi:hypothetical protein